MSRAFAIKRHSVFAIAAVTATTAIDQADYCLQVKMQKAQQLSELLDHLLERDQRAFSCQGVALPDKLDALSRAPCRSFQI